MSPYLLAAYLTSFVVIAGWMVWNWLAINREHDAAKRRIDADHAVRMRQIYEESAVRMLGIHLVWAGNLHLLGIGRVHKIPRPHPIYDVN